MTATRHTKAHSMCMAAHDASIHTPHPTRGLPLAIRKSHCLWTSKIENGAFSRRARLDNTSKNRRGNPFLLLFSIRSDSMLTFRAGNFAILSNRKLQQTTRGHVQRTLSKWQYLLHFDKSQTKQPKKKKRKILGKTKAIIFLKLQISTTTTTTPTKSVWSYNTRNDSTSLIWNWRNNV